MRTFWLPPSDFDAVVPAVGDVVAVDVAVGAGEAAEAAVMSAADDVVVSSALVGPAFVVADDVVAFGFPEDDGLRAVGMAMVLVVFSAQLLEFQVG